MSDETPFERGLDEALQRAYREIEDLKTELKRREAVWLGRLQAADARAERILRQMSPPPVLFVDKKPEWMVIEVSEAIYLRDFFRSFGRRLRRHLGL